MHEIPTTKDELERKVLDFVTETGQAFELEDMDPMVAAMQFKAIWTVTSGLIDDELSATLAQYADSIGPQSVRILFVGQGRTLLLVYPPRGSGYALVNIDPKTAARTVITRSQAEPGERAPAMARLIEGLKAKGFTRI